MILEPTASFVEVFQEPKGKDAFLRDVIVLLVSYDGKPLFIDAVRTKLGDYKPPSRIQFRFKWVVLGINESAHLECVARRLQEVMRPLYPNDRLKGECSVSIGGVEKLVSILRK